MFPRSALNSQGRDALALNPICRQELITFGCTLSDRSILLGRMAATHFCRPSAAEQQILRALVVRPRRPAERALIDPRRVEPHYRKSAMLVGEPAIPGSAGAMSSAAAQAIQRRRLVVERGQKKASPPLLLLTRVRPSSATPACCCGRGGKTPEPACGPSSPRCAPPAPGAPGISSPPPPHKLGNHLESAMRNRQGRRI